MLKLFKTLVYKSCILLWVAGFFQECVKSSHFHLCTVLIMSSLDFDCTQHMQCLENSLNNLEESGIPSRKQVSLVRKY